MEADSPLAPELADRHETGVQTQPKNLAAVVTELRSYAKIDSRLTCSELT